MTNNLLNIAVQRYIFWPSLYVSTSILSLFLNNFSNTQ